MKFFHIVPKTCFQGHLKDILKTSWRRLELTSQGHPLDIRLGRSLDVRLRRFRVVSSGRPRDGQIRSLQHVLGMLDGDVLEKSWGLIFAR